MEDPMNTTRTCRICFVVDESVVNRINPLHESFIQKITQEKLVITKDAPSKLCHDCLRRLLDANYFRQLVLESNNRVMLETSQHALNKIKLEKCNKDEDIETIEEEPEVDVDQVEIISSTDETHIYEYLSQPLTETPIEQTFSCCMCSLVFMNEEDIVEHCHQQHQMERLVSEPTEEQFICHNCCLEFETSDDLMIHKTCDLCLSIFNCNEKLVQHREQCQKPRTESPTPKNEKQERPKNLAHNLAPSIFPCCLCATLFDHEEERLEHCEATHGFIFDASMQLDPNSPKCFFCERRFTQLNAYYSHFEDPCRNQNRCKKCGRKFLHSDLLIQHNQNIHASVPSYQCQKCQLSFHSSSAYYSHNHRYHAKRSRFRCDICSKEYLTPSKLQEHVNIHYNIKPFQCAVCTKGFFRKDNLKNHMRLHSKEKPFTCGYCNKLFSHQTDKKRHEWTHTGNYPFKCEHCGRGFTKLLGYEAHKRNGVEKCKERKEMSMSSRKNIQDSTSHPDVYEMVLEDSEAIELEVINEDEEDSNKFN